jgi:hypothetical protein
MRRGRGPGGRPHGMVTGGFVFGERAGSHALATAVLGLLSAAIAVVVLKLTRHRHHAALAQACKHREGTHAPELRVAHVGDLPQAPVTAEGVPRYVTNERAGREDDHDDEQAAHQLRATRGDG